MTSSRTTIAVTAMRLAAIAIAMAPAAPAAAQRMPTVAPRSFPRPFTIFPAPGELTDSFLVLGVANRAFSTGNLGRAINGDRFADAEFFDVMQVPLCTKLVVPVLTGWDLAYGTVVGDASRTTDTGWNREDKWFGQGRIDLSVVAYEVDPAAGPEARDRPNARIRIRLLLSDTNGDDRWWGVVRYQLLFLGNRRTTGGLCV